MSNEPSDTPATLDNRSRLRRQELVRALAELPADNTTARADLEAAIAKIDGLVHGDPATADTEANTWTAGVGSKP